MKTSIALLLGFALALSAGCQSARPEEQTNQPATVDRSHQPIPAAVHEPAALPEIRYFMIADT